MCERNTKDFLTIQRGFGTIPRINFLRIRFVVRILEIPFGILQSVSVFRSFLRGLLSVCERNVVYSDRFWDAMNLHSLLQDN